MKRNLPWSRRGGWRVPWDIYKCSCMVLSGPYSSFHVPVRVAVTVFAKITYGYAVTLFTQKEHSKPVRFVKNVLRVFYPLKFPSILTTHEVGLVNNVSFG